MMLKNIIYFITKQLLPVVPVNDAEKMLKQAIIQGKPMMCARFGAVEIKSILYATLCYPFSLLLKQYTFAHLGNNAGYFPITRDNIVKFSRLMKGDFNYLDFLASWRPEEIFFKNLLKNAIKIPLVTLDPNKTKMAWSQALQGKKVLVIHPFANTIKSQYESNRSKLFGEYSDYVLPEFASLQVIQAVQTIAGNRAGFETWFDALEYMEQEIDKCDFDVALIGCGAYGFPLAAYCKKIGKQGIHIGGPLQLYFGIKGKRWDDFGFYNEYWVNPDESEKPKNLEKVEGGCYW